VSTSRRRRASEKRETTPRRPARDQETPEAFGATQVAEDPAGQQLLKSSKRPSLMLMPKRVKEGRRKMHRGRMKAKRPKETDSFGDYGLVALEPSWITSRQIEAARIAMTRHIKRGGKVWIRIFPDKSYTKKPLETRMGKGKAPVEDG